jgi:hypothetical protein
VASVDINSNGTVTLTHDDGSSTTVRDEVTYQRILTALRSPGEPYVHVLGGGRPMPERDDIIKLRGYTDSYAVHRTSDGKPYVVQNGRQRELSPDDVFTYDTDEMEASARAHEGEAQRIRARLAVIRGVTSREPGDGYCECGWRYDDPDHPSHGS